MGVVFQESYWEYFKTLLLDSSVIINSCVKGKIFCNLVLSVFEYFRNHHELWIKKMKTFCWSTLCLSLSHHGLHQQNWPLHVLMLNKWKKKVFIFSLENWKSLIITCNIITIKTRVTRITRTTSSFFRFFVFFLSDSSSSFSVAFEGETVDRD